MLRRGASRSSGRCCGRKPRVLRRRRCSRHARAAGRRSSPPAAGRRLDRALVVLPRGEGKNEYLPSLRGVRLRPALRARPLRRARARRCPCTAPATRPGLLLVDALPRARHARTRLAAFCIVVGRAQRAAHLRAGQAAVRRARRPDRRRARRVLARRCCTSAPRRADAVYLTLGLLAAIPLLVQRRIVLGAIALAVVSLFAWSLLAVGAWAAILVLARDGFKPALKLARSPADRAARASTRCSRSPPASTRSAPSTPRSDVYAVGIASPAPVRVLAVRLPHRVPADPRRADRLARARAPAAARARGDRDLRRDRDRRASLGFTKAETERIWLFLVPFVCLAAAPARPPPDAAGRRCSPCRPWSTSCCSTRCGERFGAAADQQPRVDPQRPAARRRRRRAIARRRAAALRRPGQPGRHQPPRAGVARAGPGRQRARADEAQAARAAPRAAAAAHARRPAPAQRPNAPPGSSWKRVRTTERPLRPSRVRRSIQPVAREREQQRRSRAAAAAARRASRAASTTSSSRLIASATRACGRASRCAARSTSGDRSLALHRLRRHSPPPSGLEHHPRYGRV